VRQSLCAFDVAVIGSGPGAAALAGLSVAIVERDCRDGCRAYPGSVSERAWYAAVRAIKAARWPGGAGIQGEAVRADLESAWHHQRHARANCAVCLECPGVAALRGNASFAGPCMSAVEGRGEIVTGHVILATGAKPNVPSVLLRSQGRRLSADALFDALPCGRRVAIVIAIRLACSLALPGRGLA